MKFHKLAAICPLMEGVTFDALVADLKANGLHEPIVIHEGKILDGRNRERGCEGAGVEPRYVEWDGKGTPLAFVLSQNVHRRHLNASQRAMIAARLANMTQGGDRKSAKIKTSIDGLKTQADAAQALNVGKASVQRAAAILRAGGVQLVKAVDEGTVRVAAAHKKATKTSAKRKHRATTKKAKKVNKSLMELIEELIELLDRESNVVPLYRARKLAHRVRDEVTTLLAKGETR